MLVGGFKSKSGEQKPGRTQGSALRVDDWLKVQDGFYFL